MHMKKIQKNKIQSNNYAFIDSQNVSLSIRNLGWNLNFTKFGKTDADIGYYPDIQQCRYSSSLS